MWTIFHAENGVESVFRGRSEAQAVRVWRVRAWAIDFRREGSRLKQPIPCVVSGHRSARGRRKKDEKGGQSMVLGCIYLV